MPLPNGGLLGLEGDLLLLQILHSRTISSSPSSSAAPLCSRSTVISHLSECHALLKATVFSVFFNPFCIAMPEGPFLKGFQLHTFPQLKKPGFLISTPLHLWLSVLLMAFFSLIKLRAAPLRARSPSFVFQSTLMSALFPRIYQQSCDC